MKLLFIILFSLFFTACNANKDKSSTPGQADAQGGVDVGNMTSAAVPQTNASMSYPNSWKGSDNGKTLVIQNSSSSKIEASRANLADLTSPNPNGLEQYLEAKYPDRNYEIVEINGLKGVRADIVKTDTEKKSDIYLVSELQDFIHIQSDLKNTDSGFEKGESIILTVRVKYNGVPVENSKATTVKLEAYYSFIDQVMNKKAAYSFLNDCYSYSDSGCNGVSVLFGNGQKVDLSAGNAGYDYGRIVELGPVDEIPLESIKVEGEYLVAPQTKVSIADIYTTFTPKDQHADLDRVSLKNGYVYLIRTIRWPDEDLIIKLRVDALVPDKSVTLTYQKLVYVKPEVLQKQVDLINKNTLENEKPLNEGEITLHNRSTWNNYFYASFNFEYSTSGNMFITYNSWDILFQNGCNGKPSLTVPHTGDAIGKVVSFGNQDLSTITKADFPDSNTYVRDCGTEVEVGKTYGVYHHRFAGDDSEAGAIYGAIQVLDMAKDNSWIRLKFRRIHLGPAEHFQKWISLSIPENKVVKTLSITSDYNARIFYPFKAKVGTEGSHHDEDMQFNSYSGVANTLSVDSRPYGSERGFFNFGSHVDIDTITLNDIESKKGSFKSDTQIHNGDIIAVYLENYFDKTVLLMKIDDHIADKSLQFTVRYLQRAKTQYSEDKD